MRQALQGAEPLLGAPPCACVATAWRSLPLAIPPPRLWALLPLAAVESEAVAAWGLGTVLTLRARVVNSYRMPRDGRLGYSPRVLKAGTAVAVIDMGFASGLPLEFFRCCAAAVGERRCSFVETPWMEYSGLLTGDELLPVGTEVELFGSTISVSAQAARAEIPVEALFLHLSRVMRNVVEE